MTEWKDLSENKLLEMVSSTEKLMLRQEESLLLLEDLRDGAIQELTKRRLELPISKVNTVISALREIYKPRTRSQNLKEFQAHERQLRELVAWLREKIKRAPKPEE